MLIFEKGNMEHAFAAQKIFWERKSSARECSVFRAAFLPSLSSRMPSTFNPHGFIKNFFGQQGKSILMHVNYFISGGKPTTNKTFFLFSTHLVPVGFNSSESRNVHSNSSQSETNIKLWIYLLYIGNRKQPSFTWLAYFLCHGSILSASFALENFQGMFEAAQGTA